MITKLFVRNFKALDNFETQLMPFTALVGANACGKSTVLHALDFIRSFATRDIEEYLRDRGWTFQDLKSGFDGSDKPICFKTLHLFTFGEERITIDWDFSVDHDGHKWRVTESITDTQTGEALLDPDIFALMDTQSSCLKFITAEMGSKYEFHPVVFALKKFMENSSCFELLSPDAMRTSGSRGGAEDIGINGRQLAAFIDKLNHAQKAELNKFIGEYLGYPVVIRTEEGDRPGRVELSLVEAHPSSEITVKPPHMSDGLLRIMAFAAISAQDKPYNTTREDAPGGLLLLDEIEDGLNHYHAENLLETFKKIVQESNRQIIVTTHSPVLLNYADPSEIIFMWRAEDGRVHSKPLFSTDEMADTLDSFNPGEVWLNYSRNELLELLNPSRQEDSR